MSGIMTDLHLEHAETGRETFSRGVSAKLERAIDMKGSGNMVKTGSPMMMTMDGD